MPLVNIIDPANYEAVRNQIVNYLTHDYHRIPRKIIFVCGDAHRQVAPPRAEGILCDSIAASILNNELTELCTYGLCDNRISLHLECGNNPVAVNNAWNDFEHPNLSDLNPNSRFGWEPDAYANIGRIIELSEIQTLNTRTRR